MNQQLLIDLLDRALGEEMGLVIKTNNPDRLSQYLHAVTKDNPRYASVSINVPSTQETVIIMKRTVELNTPEVEDV